MDTYVIVKRIAPHGWDGIIASQLVRGKNGLPLEFLDSYNALTRGVEEQMRYPQHETRVRHDVITKVEAQEEFGERYDIAPEGEIP